MKQTITIVLIIILLFNIIGCSSIQIKNENEKIENKKIEEKYTDTEKTINIIGWMFGIGGMILGGYIGYNLFPGKDMLKVWNIILGSSMGECIFFEAWYLSVIILENRGLLDTKISTKILKRFLLNDEKN
jgi:hypothetical protein